MLFHKRKVLEEARKYLYDYTPSSDLCLGGLIQDLLNAKQHIENLKPYVTDRDGRFIGANRRDKTGILIASAYAQLEDRIGRLVQKINESVSAR
ncbi:MAG: hypothetical protein WC533_00655 [Candidatus Pacearchaeota archaeon]